MIGVADAPPLLSTHWLYAAVNVARTVVGGGGWDSQQLRESYWESPTGGTLGLSDLQHGQQLLEHLGLLVWRDDLCYPAEGLIELADLPEDVAMRLLMHRAILRERPLWLFELVGVDDETIVADLPETLDAAMRQLYPNPDALAAELHGLARTVDADLLREIGVAGEEHVVEECRSFFRDSDDPGLAHLVQRVSAFDDTLGFDVTATDRRSVRHKLEIKTTTVPPGASIRLYLSRNEARVGLANHDWSLVAVRDWFNVQGERELQTVGWLDAPTFASVLPTGERIENGLRGQWQSVRLDIPVDAFRPGLPLNQIKP